ncbi:outer membrane beta-barrel protein [Algibacter mikhailovii]|uniref:Outer membrane protein beta-barrel domain-containing protein n=1 Tax=Algibacter mikhailovii TaxID=425498 RepID=A0A918R0T1_9FLAO|nr:outer membrane beta-barrel protein [Algibacter mikhailovii]GGZ77749.1 hypothetical protein GCM10007028_13820 [Algibacter mikhailovii]
MKTRITTTIAMLLVTAMAFCQNLKVTGGASFMSVKYASNIPIVPANGPSDEPTDTPTDVTTKVYSQKALVDTNNTSSITSKGTNNETGFYLGLALSDFNVFGNFEFQPELRFVGVKDFNQIQVPVLLSYPIKEKFHVFAGPSFAFLLDPAPNISSFNFAVDFGVAYDISEKIAIDARYVWGQTNLLENGDSNNYIKINQIQVGIAYRFGK